MPDTKNVFVSGGSGFIASHVILQLIQQGHKVVASVRSMSRGEDLMNMLKAHVSDHAALKSRLSFRELNLLKDDGWNEAVRGCDVVIHTASPFPAVVPEDPDELVRPAVDGALRALKAAKAEGIDRVIQTSSVAAIWYSSLEAGKTSYTESNWTDPDKAAPYARSKALAERAAWDFVASATPQIDLTVINPALVVGEPLGQEVSTSLKIIKRIFRGGGWPQQRGAVCIVDVRDVARMHVEAINTPDSFGKRIICSARMITYREIAEILNRAYPSRNISTEVEAGEDTSGREQIEVDNALGRKVFGLDYISAEETVLKTAAFFAQLE